MRKKQQKYFKFSEYMVQLNVYTIITVMSQGGAGEKSISTCFTRNMRSNMKKTGNIFRRKSVVFTFVIIMMISVVTAIAAFNITQLEEINCYEALFQAGDQLNLDIARLISYDKEQLEAFAGIFSEYDQLNCRQITDIVNHYQQCGMVSRLEILLPDNTLILQNGTRIEAGEATDFSTEADKGSYLTSIQPGTIVPERRVLRNIVPIVKDGVVTGMLHGVVDLEDLQNVWNMNVYGVKADIYIVERSTGDYIVNTACEELGNVSEIDANDILKRSSDDLLESQLKNGQKGYAVFSMPGAEENLYFCYMPCKINNWELAISVPERVVFENVDDIKMLLVILVAFEFLCFLVYMLWMVRESRLQNMEKQERLELLTFTGRVQELLFEAHQNEHNIELALELIGKMTDAQYAFFKILGEEGKEQIYQWLDNNPENITVRIPEEREHFFMHYFYFKDGSGSIFLPNIEELKVVSPSSYELLVKEGIHNFMAVPVNDVSGRLVGALGVCNMNRKCRDTHILDAVKLSFSMLYHNIRSYNIIREMGTVDLLTGLLNRNCYQKNIKGYPKMRFETLACVYCDVNGLHELNNTKGHEAGDVMLKTVAETIKNYFEQEHSYRIGGDEFVAFVLDEGAEEVAKRTEAVAKKLEAKQYYVSIGISIGRPKDLTEMEELVKNAETEMYASKKIFYENCGRDRRGRM